jgi:uncharacterized protein YuzE
MQVTYDSVSDILYIRINDKTQQIINKRVNDFLVLDMGQQDQIVGIEIQNASMHTNLENILPIQYRKAL